MGSCGEPTKILLTGEVIVGTKKMELFPVKYMILQSSSYYITDVIVAEHNIEDGCKHTTRRREREREMMDR